MAPLGAVAVSGLNAYQVKATARKLRELKRHGFDITEGHRRGGIEIVATQGQVSKLRGKGLKPKLLRDRRGRTARRAAAARGVCGSRPAHYYS
jgi:hypothetical protein